MTDLIIIGGPCSVESQEQITKIYGDIHHNIDIFRGGAYKPRTSVKSFQGLGPVGLEYLKQASSKPIVSEIMDTADLEHFIDVDYIQIGARNMQNFALLKKVGTLNKPVLLKRGLASTVEELLAAAEYLTEFGASEVILCERGIRTFSDSSRFTLDMAAVLKIKKETNYKVIVDVSHAAGNTEMIEDLALSSVALGADGIMIETHNNPEIALSDKDQQLTTEDFNKLVIKLRDLSSFVKKLKK
ncbi:3-deoxy-7-phosphoheptulonate synthase [Mollicutes bacterium LVI A0039]|nr:3-deoxy-7-phosphoheptulonate synthase [Mollicutes bacterium LVI A0039]